MVNVVDDTLQGRYAALQAERQRTWSAAQLAGNARQRQILVDRFDPTAIVQSGDALPDFSFAEVDGGSLSLTGLVAQAPVLLIFFRFAGCPACNIALSYYAEHLYPALSKLGVAIVALSPQRTDRLVEIKKRHQLPFWVASDHDNGLGRHIGITFEPDDRPTPLPAGWIGEVTGTNSWELPQPTILLVGAGREVRWVHVSPDWLDRPEAGDIVREVEAATGVRRAA
jgi:peroxiredoxin